MGRATWLVRGCVALTCAATLFAGASSCGDDSSIAGSPTDAAADRGPDGKQQPQPLLPYDAGKPPPEGVDTTGRLGSPTLIADVGKPIDGPSWHVRDQALYFNVPNEAPTLRRVSSDGGVEPVAAYDGGPPGPYGSANGGGDRVFLTEPNAIATLDLDPDAGAGITARRSGTFQLLGDIAADRQTDASVQAFFVDTAVARAYRYQPGAGANDLTRLIDRDAGRATAIAVGHDDLNDRLVYIAIGNGASATIVVVADEGRNQTAALDGGVVKEIPLPNTPPNGIALDDQGYVLVAWARGIDVYTPSGTLVGSSPGLAIGAAPTSLTFGGANRKTLYVTTAAGKIYAIPTFTSGVLR